MKKIPAHLLQILGAEFVGVGLAGAVSLHGAGGIAANVARVSGDGAVRHHPDMAGNERSPEWRAALERALSLRCPYCGQWNLFVAENCLCCGQTVEV